MESWETMAAKTFWPKAWLSWKTLAETARTLQKIIWSRLGYSLFNFNFMRDKYQNKVQNKTLIVNELTLSILFHTLCFHAPNYKFFVVI